MEEKELVTWINDCALSQAGKYREQIAEKVREILKMRHKMNKRGGRLNVPLSKPAARVVLGGVVTKDWFNHFFARNMDKIKWYVPQHIDTQRAASNTEEAVEAHFEGRYGLRQELSESWIQRQVLLLTLGAYLIVTNYLTSFIMTRTKGIPNDW